VRSYGEAVDAGLTSPTREPHTAVRSARGSCESAKMALDTTCRALIIVVERYAVTLTPPKWEIPDHGLSRSGP